MIRIIGVGLLLLSIWALKAEPQTRMIVTAAIIVGLVFIVVQSRKR